MCGNDMTGPRYRLLTERLSISDRRNKSLFTQRGLQWRCCPHNLKPNGYQCLRLCQPGCVYIIRSIDNLIRRYTTLFHSEVIVTLSGRDV